VLYAFAASRSNHEQKELRRTGAAGTRSLLWSSTKKQVCSSFLSPNLTQNHNTPKTMAPSPIAHRRQTSFLIPNLHCPTCVSHVTSIIDDLDLTAVIRDISIINHVVTIAHEIPTSSISEALTSAGYEIFDIIYDAASTEEASTSAQLQEAVQRWAPQQHSEVDETTRLLHDTNCQMCAASNTQGGGLEHVAAASVDSTPLFVATLSVEGMTCSSCVGNVTKALDLPGVERADVSLIGHSASVHFRADDNQEFAERLVEAIEDAGYDAQLMEVQSGLDTNLRNGPHDELGMTNDATRRTRRTLSLRIEGMHCPRCPKRIADEVQSLGVDLQKSPTLDSPILTISYVPKAPSFTIRRILDEICALDPSFRVSVYKPASVEQRSREMLAKEQRAIFLRALLSTITAVPSLVIGIVYMNLVSKHDPGYMWLMHPLHGVSRAEWAMFATATPVYFFATDYFHRRMIKEIYSLWRPRSPVPITKRFIRFGSMNLLISFGTTIAYFSSLAQLIISATSTQDMMESSKMSYFDSVVFLTMFLLLGRLAEAHMKTKSGDAISALGNLRPTEAVLTTPKDGESAFSANSKVDVDLIEIGDTVKVLHGSSPPCDGTLIDEEARFDESSLTGESRLIRKVAGDTTYSGTINKGSAVTIRVTGPAGASMLDSIIAVVREGQSKRAPMERIADLLTAYFVPVVVLIAILTWLVWLTLGLSGALPESYLDNGVGGWPFWSLQFAIAVFVIACPCGLGLAAPTALFVGGGMAAQRGILVKGGGEAFQEASNLDAVIFDKTGTLTEGAEPKIVHHVAFDADLGLDRATVLGVLKSVEENSSHPLAKAAVNFAAQAEDTAVVQVTAVDEIAGKGLKAKFEYNQRQHEVLVGNGSLVEDYGVAVTTATESTLESWKSSGCSVILMACRAVNEPWKMLTIFAASDPLRPEAIEVVASLQKRGIDVWMLSGDNPSTANAVGKQVGIHPENIIAGVLPAQKADKVKYLQQILKPRPGTDFQSVLLSSNKRNRATIAMVGDGINDAPALAAADVGIAVASGSDVAVQSASFILVHSDLRAVLTLVSLSRAVFRRVILNFVWAALYNIIALPVAAGVLYPITTGAGTHVRLDPAWAALAMALSSITVVASSLLLRTKVPLVGFREALGRS
jgi:Cu+-exporting ATPase